MGCIKLDILDNEYRKSEIKESCNKKELTFNFSDKNAGRSLFSAKELDEESQMYYFEARYYDPPTFISSDPLFEKYPWISRYAYCANNPIRYIDPDGCDWVEREIEGRKEVFYDRKVKSQADVDKRYGKNSGVTHLADGSQVGDGRYTVYNDHKDNKYGFVIDNKTRKVVNNDREIRYGENFTLFAGVTDQSVDASTLYKNLFGSSYIGGNNPKNYKGKENFDYKPTWSPTEMAAYCHDLEYIAAGASGATSAFFNVSEAVISADIKLVYTCYNIAKDPSVSASERKRAKKTAKGFNFIIQMKWY